MSMIFFCQFDLVIYAANEINFLNFLLLLMRIFSSNNKEFIQI